MKKCLIGLLVMILSIIPVSKVKADFNINLKNGEHVVLPDKPDDGHNVFYIFKSNKLGTYHLFAIDNNDIADRVMIRSMYGNEFNIGFTYSGTDGIPNTTRVNQYVYNDKTFTWEFLREATCTGTCYFPDIDGTNQKYTASQLLFSNVDVYTYTYKITVNSIDTNLNLGTYEPKTLIYSADITIPREYLIYTSNFANDLDGNEIYNIRFNAKNYNSNYQYLIRTSQEIEWTDITELLNNEAFQYDYSLSYNTTLYMQVLNTNGEILETKTHTISDLKDFQFNISHNEANDLNNRLINVVIVDVRNIYFSDYKYQYSFDNQIFYDMEITEDNKIYNLPHTLNIPIHFRILNAGDIVIHEQIYNGNFENVKKEINFFEKTNINDNKKEVIVQVDFTEYLKFYDMYNFKIWIDDIEYDEQTFIKEFILTEENYVKAIRVKMSVDNLILENFTYRIGTITGTGGGSDNDFNGIYDNVLENELNNELKEQDYSTIPGMVDAVKNFIKATGEYITTFFELIMYFFNKLNVWIKTCIIALFIELIIFKTIKAVRR